MQAVVMNPPGKSDDYEIDAVFFSPHKVKNDAGSGVRMAVSYNPTLAQFVGGPGASGVLIIKRALLDNPWGRHPGSPWSKENPRLDKGWNPPYAEHGRGRKGHACAGACPHSCLLGDNIVSHTPTICSVRSTAAGRWMW